VFLDDEARAAFGEAVVAIESRSAVEVVIAVRRRSARYVRAHVAVGAAVAFAGLALMLYSTHAFALTSILFDPFIAAALGAGAVVVAPPLERVFVSRAARRRSVASAARATFVERGVHATVGRSGLLVYISWLEREVALVADLGLARALPKGALAHAEDELTAAMPRGGAEVARRLAALAETMARAMPHRAEDTNELPDAIDSDMG
jgi:putative membrane protein